MPAGKQTRARRGIALLLALLVGVYQAAISAHDLLHWHPETHHHARPAFASPAAQFIQDDHDDEWFEQVLCTLSAAGVASKSVPLDAMTSWPLCLGASYQPTYHTPRLANASWRTVPPARGPPAVH